jgi:glycosyltransferase involved in cell wall biosynthesis
MKMKVSIIIPLFNKEKFIKETLTSVLNQTFQEWECLIIDDFSTDSSAKIVKEFTGKDKRFKFLPTDFNSNIGASASRNIGLKNAKGIFIQFLDADDLISSNKLEEQVRLLEKDNSTSLVTCAWGRFNDSKVKKAFSGLNSYSDFDSPDLFLDSLIYSKGYFPVHSYLIRRDLIDLGGWWNENLSLNDDGEFMMRIISKSNKIKFAHNSIAWYRWSDGNNLSSYSDKVAVNKAIYSWVLVETSLKIRFDKFEIPYVEWMKKALFINLKKSYPELIDKHSFFFKKQLEESKFWNRIEAKIIRTIGGIKK